MGGIDLAIRPIFKLRLIRVRGSLALSRSYKDSHIDANSLVRDNRETLRRRADMLGHAILNIQNIIARRQRHSIVPLLIDCHPRDFFSFGLTQNNQGILSVGSGRTLCAWHLIRFSHRHTEDNFQMSFQETWGSGFNRCRASNQKSEEGRSQIFKEYRHEQKK